MVVYPRWRGELDRTASVVSSGSGLSPLARGTPVFANLWTIAIRFIPAGAGNTGSATAAPMTTSVYPRWRGEHEMLVSVNAANTGLSPLARGTHILQNTRLISTRFIPAGAGNTALSFSYYRPATVYPRWRGEHYRTDCRILFFCGLSPLVRGTQRQVVAALRGRRFIPAGAGNTYIRAKNKATATVYPRWRGEHAGFESSGARDAGLSPLARGTHLSKYKLL